MNIRFVSRGALTLALAALTVCASAQTPTTLYNFNGDTAGDLFGASVSGAGDVNGDGLADIIIGAYSDDNNGTDSGSATVLSGLDGSILYKFDGDSPYDYFGFSVSGAGDVNDDGFADLVVGAFGDDNNGVTSGIARVFSGLDGSILYTFAGDSEVDEFGYSVSGAGDVNGDGFADIIVGAPFDDNNGSKSGHARVFSGFDGSVLHMFDGDSSGDLFGFSVSGAGDVNADGFADLLVGSRNDDINGLLFGSALVFSGIDGSLLYQFSADSANDRFGHSVSGAGDVNGDGYADIIVGALADDNNGYDSGSARVFSGYDGAILYTFNGDYNSDLFGLSVSGAGDINSDGFADLIVGAYLDDNNGSNSGSARVLSGFDGSILYTFDGDSAGDQFGNSVSGAGDVNGDGCPDIVIGAFRDDNNGVDSGSVRIISLPCTPPDPCTQLENLTADVIELNLSRGIENSLDAKLDAAAHACVDAHAGNNSSAVNILNAFINAVEAQSGNQISTEAADALIASAQAIIDLLNST